jgi:quinol monooxygenase YgiN
LKIPEISTVGNGFFTLSAEGVHMILVIYQMDVLAEKKKEFLQAVPEILGDTAQQPGCIGHCICRDIEDEYRIFTIQAWENQIQLDAHWRSDRYSTFLGTFHLLKNEPVVQIHAVSFTAGMEAVKAARAKPKPPGAKPLQD